MDIEDKIMEIMQELCDRVKLDTGYDILIGVGIKNGNTLIEGAKCSPNLTYPDACQLVTGIVGFVTDHYGHSEDCNGCSCINT